MLKRLDENVSKLSLLDLNVNNFLFDKNVNNFFGPNCHKFFVEPNYWEVLVYGICSSFIHNIF